jgi:hypothetical protein
MISVVDNTLTAIKSEIKRLKDLGYKVTEITIFAGIIVYEEA